MHPKNLLILYRLSQKIKFKGARAFLTTKELGDFLGISQQSASRYLKNLEREGLIKRDASKKGQWIEITKEGANSLSEIYQNLEIFLEIRKRGEKILRGKVVKGLGDGAYYVKAYSQKIKGKLGFKPYPGTLNLKLLTSRYSRKDAEREATIKIKEFSRGDRIFGEIKLLPAKIFKEKCYLIIPQRTHHPENEIEIIHQDFLRKKFNLKDEDVIEVKVGIS